MSQEMFNHISSRYDRANRWLSLGLDQPWRQTLTHHLPKKQNLSLLDIATGTGDQMIALFDSKTVEHAIGIDLSEKMLEIARIKLSKTPYSHSVEFLLGNAESLPFKEPQFDVCSISFGLRNMKNPLLALTETYRVTKSGGRCLILEFSMPHHPFRWPYLFYLRAIVPFLGGWIAHDYPAYRYLNQTIRSFSQAPVLDWMKEAGWINTKTTRLSFGSVTIYQGDKA